MFSSYFLRISNYSTFRFILEVTALAFLSRFILVLPIALLLSIFSVDLGKPNIEVLEIENQFWQNVFIAVIIAPIIETIIFQWFPLTIFKLLRVPSIITLIITTYIFAYAHLDDGLINFIGMLPIGLLFVWAFYVRRRISVFNAMFTVFAIHSLTNALAVTLFILGI